MIEAILGGVGTAAGQFGEILTNAFNAVQALFVTSGTSGMELTLMGSILVIAIAATVVTFGLRLILKLINRVRVSA
jgi:hypothetical protein